MDNRINAQSPNFKLYKKGDVRNIAKYINKQKPEVLNTIAENMEKGVEQLAGTKLAHGVLVADPDGRTLYHNIVWKKPQLDEKGAVTMVEGSITNLEDGIDEIIKKVLAKENELSAVDVYTKRIAEALAKMQ